MDVLYTSFLECWILSSVFPLSSLSLMDVYLESTKLEEPIRKTLFAKLKGIESSIYILKCRRGASTVCRDLEKSRLSENQLRPDDK